MSARSSQCTHHSSDVRNFDDSGEMCSGIVILGLILALVLAQETQANRPQHLIHVPLTDQGSIYNHLSRRPQFLKSPEGPVERYCFSRF